MTKEYMAGFCKKAEEYGVNGESLYKEAFSKESTVNTRLMNNVYRLKSQSEKQKRDTGVEGTPVSEFFGTGTSAALAALIGAGAGNIFRIGDKINLGSRVIPPGWVNNDRISTQIREILNRNSSTILGAAGGIGVAALASVIAKISAAIKRRRTAKEQVEHDKGKGTMLKNLLIPGYGEYNMYKRLGRSAAEEE